MNKRNLTLLTGRVFMCLGISEDEDYDCMRDFFEVGGSYHEVKYDIDNANLTDGNDLLIQGRNDLALYVSKNDFALMLDLSDTCQETLDKMKKQ